MEDFNASTYDDDLVNNLLLMELINTDQSTIERMASLSDVLPVLKNQVAVAGSNSQGAGLHMDRPQPLDRSSAANNCDFQTSNPISFSNHDACEDYAILPTGFDDLLKDLTSDKAILPVSEDHLESDNAVLSALDYVQAIRSEDHAISMITPERTQDKEADNFIDENHLRNYASLVLSDHSKAVEVVAVVGNPPPRQVPATIGKNPPPDGHNWRKYGQKHVKNSKFPRSYYRCTLHPICKVTKKIEYSPEGHVAEIIYKGSHNHPKANPSCDHVSNNLTKQMAVNDNSSRERNQDQYTDTVELSLSARSACQPKYTISIESTHHEVFDDGFRWRKYGQKVVKGNSNPRSYYRCTHPECTVRKHIERAPNDTKLVLTTYEGHHEHEIPATRNNLNYVATTPSLNWGGPRVSSDHQYNQGNNMVLEARVEAPTTMANQLERFTGFEFHNPPLNMFPRAGTISAEQWASPNVSFGSAIMPFVGLHGLPLGPRVVTTVMAKEERTQELGASSSMAQLPLQANVPIDYRSMVTMVPSSHIKYNNTFF